MKTYILRGFDKASEREKRPEITSLGFQSSALPTELSCQPDDAKEISGACCTAENHRAFIMRGSNMMARI